MNRQPLFNEIESSLSLLAYRIEVRGSINLLDLNLHSENFYMHFLNLLFEWNLLNINTVLTNAEGIDLVDTGRKLVVQVSSTATEQKINSSLSKDLSKYTGYLYKFISISKSAKRLRSKTYLNPHKMVFSPQTDIFDIQSLLRFVYTLPMERLENVSQFIRKEIRTAPSPEEIESNLTTIINILSEEDLDPVNIKPETTPYDIQAKVNHNKLEISSSIIDDYKIYYARINKIYSTYDSQGVNKSLSVLESIRSTYIQLSPHHLPDECFLELIKNIKIKIINSANYSSLPDEELDLYVRILIVDAFIRCKIYENPSGYLNANT